MLFNKHFFPSFDGNGVIKNYVTSLIRGRMPIRVTQNIFQFDKNSIAYQTLAQSLVMKLFIFIFPKIKFLPSIYYNYVKKLQKIKKN